MTRHRWMLAIPLLLPCPALAQGVLVAPHAVYIDHATRSGSITISNPGDEPVEVGIAFGFGYPTTDSAGTVRLDLLDSVPAGEPSALGWLQAFPRQFLLGPRQQQTLRLLATPPAGLPDGEYWARMLVSAKGGKVPVAGVPDSGAISVGLTLEVRTIIGVSYRKGALTTGLALAPVSAVREGDSVMVRVPMTRTGTAAYLGTARVEVVNARGESLGDADRAVAVYYTLDPRMAVPVGSLPAGAYKVRVQVSTDRTDLPPRAALPAPPVRDSVEFTIP
jgi:hypothetical protein